jgi:hypothetical protein
VIPERAESRILCRFCRTALLVGDSAKHRSVERGGALRVLVAKIKAFMEADQRRGQLTILRMFNYAGYPFAIPVKQQFAEVCPVL